MLATFTTASMGFDQTAVVTVPMPQDSISATKLDYLRNRLLAIKGIQQVSFNNATPAENNSWWTPFNFDHAKKGTDFPASCNSCRWSSASG